MFYDRVPMSLFLVAEEAQRAADVQWTLCTRAHEMLMNVQQITGIDYPFLRVALAEQIASRLLKDASDVIRTNLAGVRSNDVRTIGPAPMHRIVTDLLTKFEVDSTAEQRGEKFRVALFKAIGNGEFAPYSTEYIASIGDYFRSKGGAA